YQLTPDALLYASAAKGFRLGGTNIPLLQSPSCDAEIVQIGVTPTDTYSTDSIWSYEAGTKVSLLDHAVQVNASGFHIKWTGIAQGIVVPGCGGFIANVGTATSNGGDISIDVRPMKGLEVGVNAAYTNAHFTNTIASDGVFSGSPLPFSPPWTANVSA